MIADRRHPDDVRQRLNQFLGETGLLDRAKVLPLTGDASDRRVQAQEDRFLGTLCAGDPGEAAANESGG